MLKKPTNQPTNQPKERTINLPIKPSKQPISQQTDWINKKSTNQPKKHNTLAQS